jgi:hypothetical protein
MLALRSSSSYISGAMVWLTELLMVGTLMLRRYLTTPDSCGVQESEQLACALACLTACRQDKPKEGREQNLPLCALAGASSGGRARCRRWARISPRLASA